MALRGFSTENKTFSELIEETVPYVLEPGSTISFSLNETRKMFEAQITIRKKMKNNHSLLFRVIVQHTANL